MLVRDLMSRNVCIASPQDTLQKAARMMAERDIGFLPVGENDRMVGMLTDRDIVVRSVAIGKDGSAKVKDAMTADVKYCFDDEDLDHVVETMGDMKVRRLPVVDRNKRLVGVVALSDIARRHDPRAAGIALGNVSGPGGPHSQAG
jgi:CBS domain-containing protein